MIGRIGAEATAYINRTPNNEPAADNKNINPALVAQSEKNTVEDKNASGVRQKKALGVEECQTCKNRRYQDGSDDPGVSFKSPTALSPGQAASAVVSHEREHYNREDAKAKDEGREVLSNSIRVFTAVCPECGKTYVSGGETRTTTRKQAESPENEAETRLTGVGKQMDIKV